MKNILVIMTGSIACAKASGFLSLLKKEGFEVETILTHSAQKFIGSALIEGLTGRKCHTDLFEDGQMMAHIDLARWADAIVAVPATAHFINSVSVGLAGDLATAAMLAAKPDVAKFIVPAMNSQMWLHPATQDSITRLKTWGHRFLLGNEGQLACGEYGVGRMLEPEAIFAEMLSTTKSQLKPRLGKHVLITSGGTIEPIDSVRAITNSSTGETGALIADCYLNAGYDVTLIASERSVLPQQRTGLSIIEFKTFSDLSQRLQEKLSEQSFDVVVHAAAVADFSIAGGSSKKKLDSDSNLTLQLKRNPKLIDSLRLWAHGKSPGVKIIGFKLTNRDAIQQATEKLFAHSSVDYVVANAIEDLPHWTLFDPELRPIAAGEDRLELAKTLATMQIRKDVFHDPVP